MLDKLVIFELDKSKNLLPHKINQLQTKIQSLEIKIQKLVSEYVKFLEQSEYIEIHYPFFDEEITIIVSKPTEKYLISVLDHRNHRICGNLMVKKIPCMNISQTKKLGEWGNYKYGKTKTLFSKIVPDKVKKIGQGYLKDLEQHNNK